MKQLTQAELKLDPELYTTVNKWLARGDGIAVYENQDPGHPERGRRKFLSYGSAAAQLETNNPSKRLPDIGKSVNRQYQLVGVYRGKPLERAAQVLDARERILTGTILEVEPLEWAIQPWSPPKDAPEEVQAAYKVLADYHRCPIYSAKDYCRIFAQWMGWMKEQGEDSEQAFGYVQICISKSAALARMIYNGEEARIRKCPTHKGHWSGLGEGYKGGCKHGCDLTGWLPNLTDAEIAEMLEQRRLAGIAAAHQSMERWGHKTPFKEAKDPERAYRNWKRQKAKEYGVLVTEFDD